MYTTRWIVQELYCLLQHTLIPAMLMGVDAYAYRVESPSQNISVQRIPFNVPTKRHYSFCRNQYQRISLVSSLVILSRGSLGLIPHKIQWTWLFQDDEVFSTSWLHSWLTAITIDGHEHQKWTQWHYFHPPNTSANQFNQQTTHRNAQNQVVQFETRKGEGGYSFSPIAQTP